MTFYQTMALFQDNMKKKKANMAAFSWKFIVTFKTPSIMGMWIKLEVFGAC